jgi:chromosome segregation ATPase
MNDQHEFQKDIQIHIHEHVGPLRERVGRIEGKLEFTDRQLTSMQSSIDHLGERLDEVIESGSILGRKLDNLKNWVVGIGMGAAFVAAGIEFLTTTLKGIGP